MTTYSNLNANTGYALKTLTVTVTAGGTFTVSFTATEYASLQTSFVIDDVSVTFS